MLSNLSNISDKVNGPMLLITAVSVALLIILTAAMVFFAIRYHRRRHPKAEESHGHMGLEVAWTVIPTIIAFGFFWYGWVGYKFMKSPPADAMVVEVTGRMWSWTHEYENGIVSAELTIPVRKAVRLNLHSTDVLHSYYIPAFKVKQDVVPGVESLFLWFEAYEEGTYQVMCAEYCGLNHSYMMTQVHVVSQADFDAWYASEGAKVAETQVALESTDGAVDESALVAAGERLSTAKGCVACHSKDGTTLVGPSFKGVYGKTETVVVDGADRDVVVDDAYIRESILNPNAALTSGFLPLMPSQEGLVTDKEIDAIIAYIKSLR